MKHSPPRLILASQSPRRKALLYSLGVPFRVVVSGVKEPIPPPGTSPGVFALGLAKAKARHVASRHPKAWVLAADTLVYRAGRFYGKPSSRLDARRMLADLSGKWHQVYTGIWLAHGRRGWGTVARTWVKMKRLPSEDIRRWSGSHLDKAGAYAAQHPKNPFVASYRGSFDTVIGLPLARVRALCKKAGLSLFPSF